MFLVVFPTVVLVSNCWSPEACCTWMCLTSAAGMTATILEITPWKIGRTKCCPVSLLVTPRQKPRTLHNITAVNSQSRKRLKYCAKLNSINAQSTRIQNFIRDITISLHCRRLILRASRIKFSKLDGSLK